MNNDTPTAAILVIGNEILSGRTQDININYIAKKLASLGIKLREVRIVPDLQTDIVVAIQALRQSVTYVFTTGGIGPTHDDITTDAIALAFGVNVFEHPEAQARLLTHYKQDQLTAARLRMARIPETATLIDNPISSAPGFRLENVFVMAGVPNIMQAMLDGVLSQLRPGPSIFNKSVSGFVAESTIAEELATIATHYPQLDIGSYPWIRDQRFGTALVVRGTDKIALEEAIQGIYQFMKRHDPEAIIE